MRGMMFIFLRIRFSIRGGFFGEISFRMSHPRRCLSRASSMLSIPLRGAQQLSILPTGVPTL